MVICMYAALGFEGLAFLCGRTLSAEAIAASGQWQRQTVMGAFIPLWVPQPFIGAFMIR